MTNGATNEGTRYPDVDAPVHLRDEHRKILIDAGISEEVIESRGYVSVWASNPGYGHDKWLEYQGFTNRQRARVAGIPGLLIPLLDADGQRWGWQLRHFDIDNGVDSVVPKYASPQGQTMHIDVPPGMGSDLRYPTEPLYVTEGSKKADSAWSRLIQTVAMLGVDCWTGTDELTGGKSVALPDWKNIALSDRKVVIAYDSDIRTNKAVMAAADRFARWLKYKKADVHILFLPAGSNGEKVGLDDYLAQGHTESDLEKLAKPYTKVSHELWWRAAVDSAGRRDGSRPRPDLTDSDLGELVGDEHMGSYFWSPALGWLRWDGRRWESVPEPMVFEAVRQALNAIYDQRHAAAREIGDESARTNRIRALTALLAASKVRAVLQVAKGRRTTTEPFDAHPDLLNVANGVIDLRTGELLDHNPELRLTKLCGTRYVPGAGHDDWTAALRALPDEATCTWMQERLGQALTGHSPPDDVLVFLHGGGQNGKTTLLEACKKAVGGDYAVALPERVLLGQQSDHPTEMMTLRDARLAVAEETPELAHLNIKRLKTLLSGGEITARLIGKDNVTWEPTHTAFLTSNYLPRVDETDHGTWRRLARVSFPFTFRSSRAAIAGPFDLLGDAGLRDRLKSGQAQREAVLAWLAEGATRWYQAERVCSPFPESVVAATEQWREVSDVVVRYLGDDRVEFDPHSHVMSSELLWDFNSWLKASGHREWSDQTFASRFGDHPRVVAREVEKKTKVRSTLPGLSRCKHRQGDLSSRLQAPPKQFAAWAGLRFCSDDGAGG
ncbi:phage/plasmid primase, P4 family [Mycobacterium sp. ITM-2016-00316]|uniref:phage/plasmid primase, P4 family n=1 Tax=Mycobacterium sp. ITM-2016-00316 TaxID=2099695 RepID=UPI00130490C7|nr:phage/plasmid primase, P4 family [Mycobacterium sp. ITM-2016-00316]WNG79958.1 phage/plasmid primase, P4 family [Mycobacterium sp. ITM-2016-00316]